MKQERRRKIRTTRQSAEPIARVSRQGALRRVQKLLLLSPTHPDAQRLIDLFDLDAEELTEAGVPYETLKVVESLHPLMRLMGHFVS